MTARLLPSRRAITPLEAAAYDVIDDVLDVLQQVEGQDADDADLAEGLTRLADHLIMFRVMIAITRDSRA
jgi:hypothetical protein